MKLVFAAGTCRSGPTIVLCINDVQARAKMGYLSVVSLHGRQIASQSNVECRLNPILGDKSTDWLFVFELGLGLFVEKEKHALGC